ncbi:Alpha/Beta hydrolase protein [Crucibulum laeve]|uniref:Alpha/Beta hydrolase protein n=1 Tax=Crucibulum laeve TaxID=68775 RepID=A0A5C3M3L9_9AGAR|nr:Alpha/Beta hydrolase protein [Crucibulum laeve]
MDDPVLESLIDPLHARSYYVLRFNSRSVGKSTGRASFTGFNEAKDLEAIIQMAMQEIDDVRSVVIVGYSHGSLIASLHPILPPPVKTSHVLLSYPLSPRGWLILFRTSYYAKKLEELVCNASSNVLVLFGDHDEFTSVSKYKAWAHELQGYSGADKSLTVVEVPGGSHFWRRAGQELGGELEQWLP